MTRSPDARPEAACRVLPSSGYVRERWRNGAGWTREIHRALPARGNGAGNDAWDWRVSIAEIESPGPFSVFPGVERESVLLHGEGLGLRIDGTRETGLLPPHGRVRYSGESALEAWPIAGAVEVFNLMWRRDRVSLQLWHRPLVGPMVVFVEPGSLWVAYLMAGSAEVSGDGGPSRVSSGDTVLLAAGESRARFLLEGGGEVLLARVDAVAPVTRPAGAAEPAA